MNFSIELPIPRIEPVGEFNTPEAAREIVQAVERSGIAAAWLSDHPIPSAHWLQNDHTGHDALDPFTGLMFVAAMTTKLKVVSNVVVLPYRNPFLVAKSAATLQQLSGGRFILGVGAGYQKLEFEALGVAFSERGKLADEAIQVIRAAWTGEVVVKQGRHFNAPSNQARPIPMPLPPIWVGGASHGAMERAARLGDGWAPFFSLPTNDPNVMASSVTSLEQLKEKLARVHEMRHKFGRTGPFDLYMGAMHRLSSHNSRGDNFEVDKYIEGVRDLKAVGATWIRLALPAPSRAAFIENMAWFKETVMPHV
jgi:probable F420-dependent oxidoreductase